MPPKKNKKGNNKGTKFVISGEEVLNASDVGKANTSNLNESGISAGKELKKSDSFIFTGTESEIQRVTTEGDDNNSSKISGLNSAREGGQDGEEEKNDGDSSSRSETSPGKEMILSQLQKETATLDLQEQLAEQLKELEEPNIDDEEAAKIEQQEREREAEEQRIREIEDQLQQKLLEDERARLTARVDHFKIIYEEIQKQASRVEVDNVESINSILKAAHDSPLPDQSDQPQDHYTETLSQYVDELEAFTDLKSELIQSITAKLEIAQKFAKTTADRQNIELAMAYLAQDKIDEAQQALDLVENEDLAQEKLSGQIKIDQRAEQIEQQEEAKSLAEEEAKRKKIQEEQEQIARELKEAEEKAEAERVADEQKREEERIQAEKKEAERQAALKEAERVAAQQKKEEERIAEENAEADRKIAAQRAEADRIEAEKAEVERLAAAAKAEADRVAAAAQAEAKRQAALKTQVEEAERIRAQDDARKKEDEAKRVREQEDANQRKADEALRVENERKANMALRDSQLLKEQQERQAKLEVDNQELLLKLQQEAENRARAAARPLQEPAPVKNPETAVVNEKKEEAKIVAPVDKGAEGQLNKSQEQTVEQPKKAGLSISTIGMIVGGIALVGTILKFTVFKNK